MRADPLSTSSLWRPFPGSPPVPPLGTRARSWAAGGRFLASLTRAGEEPAGVVTRPTRVADVVARVVEPRATEPTATVLVVHGLAPSGADDPRILGVARAAAALGFRAVVPHVEPLARCELTPEGPAALAAALAGTLARPDLAPTGRVSVFAACVSASLSLVAATDRAVADRIESMLLVGPYADVDAMLDHLLAGADDLGDDYGRVVLLRSWARHLVGELPAEVERALWLRLVDGHAGSVGGAGGQAAAYLAERPHVREHLARLESRALRHELAATLKREHRGLLDRMSPIQHVERLRARRIVLVHGADDPIVPSRESSRLRTALWLRTDRRVRLCVTPLLGHGDRRPITARAAAEALRLVGAFATFCEPVAGPRRRPRSEADARGARAAYGAAAPAAA